MEEVEEVANFLLGLLVLVVLCLLIWWAITRHDRREVQEREDAFRKHKAETDHRLVASQERQKNARAVKEARRKQEEHEKKMETLATAFYVATFPYWYWKDQRESRDLRRRLEDEQEHGGW